jgi:TRAP-type mannitol/chloroaromatic compound transport system permease large subunit
MELFFLLILIVLMAGALASGFPVAFALPGSAIIAIGLAALTGEVFVGNPDAYFAQGSPINWLTAGTTNLRGIYWEVERDTLIAIPLFVFMGIMLQRSKIAEDLLVAMAQLFGPIRGGLGISVVFVGALLAATTGIVGATVVAMGLISLPAMLRNNYSHSLATGTIAASGTLGQIIPPSIVLIILADQLANAVDQAGMARTADYKAATGNFALPSEFGVVSTSAGDMFMGALLPGLVLVALYMAYILVVSYLNPKIAPAVAYDGAYDRAFLVRAVLALFPPLVLIFIVLGSIIAGIATVNQAGAIGAAGALVMAGYRLYDGHRGAFYPAIMALLSLIAILVIINVYTVNVKDIKDSTDAAGVTLAAISVFFFTIALLWSGYRTLKIENTMQEVMMETAKTSSLVFIILLGAAMLTAAFRAFGGEELVRDFLLGLPGGFWTQFIIVMAVIFVLGFFLEFIEIAVVVVPIVAPILLADPSANITAVWLGVMIGLNIQTSFLTPPFGFALFYLRGVAPAIVRTISMYKGVIPFIALQLLALVIVGSFPQLVNYLPTRLSLTAETAPPPKNPKLQMCIEEFIATDFAENGAVIRAAIAKAQTWDLSMVPQKVATNLTASIAKSEASFGALAAARDATANLQAAAGDFRPLQRVARKIERQTKEFDATLKVNIKELDRLRRRQGEDAADVIALADRIAELTAARDAAEAALPEGWAATDKAFQNLIKAEKKARMIYRRTVDSAYEPVGKFIATLQSAEGLEALTQKITALRNVLDSGNAETITEEVKAVEKLISAVPESGAVRSAVSKIRRAVRGKKPDFEKAGKAYDTAITVLTDEITWRTAARNTLLASAESYDAAIKNTIGLRLQNKIPKEVALYLSKCTAGHRDISLYF